MDKEKKQKKLCPLRQIRTSQHVDADVEFLECIGEKCAWFTYQRISEENDILEGCALIFLAKQC